jgi:hypothetical protein
MRMLLGRDETEQKRTELSGAIFVFIAEAETNTETLETNMKADTSENRHGTNTVRTQTKKRMIIRTKRLQSCRKTQASQVNQKPYSPNMS